MANSPIIFGPNGATSLVSGGITLPGSTSGTIQIQPNAATTSYTINLPSVQGSSSTYLGNDGSGNLSWTSPSSTIPVTSQTTTYTATTSDGLILCSGSAFTVTLPAASNAGQILRIQKTDSSATNIITISRAGSDTIEGDTSTTLNTQYEIVTLVADGTSTWYILDRNYNGAWSNSLSFTPNNFGTVSSASYYSRRNGSNLEVTGAFNVGTIPSSQIGSITLPSGYTIDSTVLASVGAYLGHSFWGQSSATGTWGGQNQAYVLFYDGSTTNTIYFSKMNAGDNSDVFYKNTSDSSGNSGNWPIAFRMNIPISGWKGK